MSALFGQVQWKLTLTVGLRRQLHITKQLKSETGHIASKEPFKVSLSPGKKYSWCRCGLSKKQPYCDGSHKGTGFSPIRFTVDEPEEEAFLCGCKQTGMAPYCDGTHATPDVQEHKT